MPAPTSLVLVAVGGYGNTYVNALLDAKRDDVVIAGVVDPFAEKGCRRIEELKALNIPFYDDLDQFFAEHSADLAVISSPIHLHTPQTLTALANHCNVLCEKPLGGTIQEATRVINARDKASLLVATGYQWSFNNAIQALKNDIMAGRMGAAKCLKTLVFWPRNEEYYGRNGWAGALRTAEGDWILDSPVNNATAHYLHNMLYVLGPQTDRAATPVSVTSELYRANPIENYDSACCRVMTAKGAEILFFTTHTTDNTRGPEFIYEFEKATVRYSGKTIIAEFADGNSIDYGNPQADIPKKLWDSIAAVQGRGSLCCGPEAARMQTLVMNGMQESAIHEFPTELIARVGETGKTKAVVSGLEEGFAQAYDDNCMPSELGLPWATPATTIQLSDYREFPQKSN